jgi:nicotinate-nucleotide adenylyltransferase
VSGESIERIGVFGGAFDPPHNAHVKLAQVALSALNLTALHVIPTGHAWHKSRPLSAPEHRLAMTRLAFAGMNQVVVDERELLRSGPSFTVDTLRALQLEHPGAQLFLVMGADQFASFEQWHQWQEIVRIAIICVAQRAGNTTPAGDFSHYSQYPGRFVSLAAPLMSVSATQIRQLVAGSEAGSLAARDLADARVEGYISAHGLYRASA